LKIFVTGGAGFIGSEFVRMSLKGNLQDIGINPTKVIVYDALTYAGNLNNLKSISSDIRYEFIQGNICDPQILDKIPDDCDLIINFAAESHVDRSIDGPDLFVKTNVLGTQNLLEAAKKKGVKKFVQISTDEVYGSIETGSWDELFPLKPNSPYAASKAAADLISLSYFKTFGLPVIITRCSNNYGYFQNVEKLIPLFITNLLAGKKVPLYGSGKNIREWIHVSDHVRGIAHAIKYGEFGEVYNIAGDTELSNLDITRLLLEYFDLNESYINYVPDRKGHDFRYALNSSKIQKIGFKNQVEFKKGLIDTITWYENSNDWYHL
jgi:dTDP-glucose 4,6-dehydratase